MQGSRLLPHYKPRQGSGGWEKEVVGEGPGLAGGCGLRANASHPVGATAIESPSNGDAKASQSSQRLPAKRLPAEKLSATKRPFCRPLPAAAASAMSCNMSRCRSAQIGDARSDPRNRCPTSSIARTGSAQVEDSLLPAEQKLHVFVPQLEEFQTRQANTCMLAGCI